jgi:hypothetical protein
MCPRISLVEGDFRETMEEKPVIWVDLALEIKAPPQGEIDIPKVRAVLYNLSRLGMQFGSITFDTYGSQESLKTLKDKGYPAEEYSLDRTKEGYEELKDAIYDERLWCYPHPLLQRELGQLEDTGKKIDHPAFPGASKDVADALAGAVHGCEDGWRKGEGARGLFQLGIVEYAGEMPQCSRHVIQGNAMTPEAEDQPPLDPYIRELLDDPSFIDLSKTDEERFGGK